MAQNPRTRSSSAARPRTHRIEYETSPKRVRVVFNGETVADSTHVLLLHETFLPPVYYFPRTDVRTDLMQASDHGSHCPFKGDAAYWTLKVGDKTAENAVWGYPEPIASAAGIKDYMAFYWNKMDAWYEEDEQVFVHPRDPYVRIDVLHSNRPVRVVLAGETLADTRRACFLFETGLPPRYYIPPEDVRTDLLEPSNTQTQCPYKGTAGYWSARLGDRLYEDLVWSYPEPLPEAAKIRDLMAFYPDKVDVIYVDGKPVAAKL